MDLMKFEDGKEYVNKGIFPGAKRIMEQDGIHYPLAFVLATEIRGRTVTEPEVIGVPFGNGEFTEDEKEAYSLVVRAMVKATKAIGVIFITEAWLATIDYESANVLQERPSEAPNREEVLFVTFEHRDGTAIWKAPIVRWGDGATLGTFETLKMDLGVGRFANLLGKLRPPQAEA